MPFAVRAKRVVEVTGDLFSCPSTVSLCHCISTDIAMGKGIAVAFKQYFGGVTELKQQKKRVGEVAVLKRGERYVYYLVSDTPHTVDGLTHPHTNPTPIGHRTAAELSHVVCSTGCAFVSLSSSGC